MQIPTLKGYDVILLGCQTWDNAEKTNCQNIVAELTEICRVLVINPPAKLDRQTQSKENFCRAGAYTQVGHNLWVYTPKVKGRFVGWMPVNLLTNSFRYWTGYRLAGEIRVVAEGLGFKKVLLLDEGNAVNYFFVSRFLKPQLFVYYQPDSPWSFHQRYGMNEPLLFRILKRADAVVSNSVYLTRSALKFNRKSFFVGEGFRKAWLDKSVVSEAPTSLQRIVYPRIGFVGDLDAGRLDIDLLAAIAVSRPDWNLTLVGAADLEFRYSMLRRLPNVFFPAIEKGHPSEEFNPFIDVWIYPLKITPRTRQEYPRKLIEFLLTGKPVVATRSDATLMFDEVVRLASDADSFVIAIEKALADNEYTTEGRGIAFASKLNWKNSVRLLDEAVASVLHSNQSWKKN